MPHGGHRFWWGFFEKNHRMGLGGGGSRSMSNLTLCPLFIWFNCIKNAEILNLKFSSKITDMIPTFKSLWTTLFLWQYSTAERICQKCRLASGSESLPCLSICAKKRFIFSLSISHKLCINGRIQANTRFLRSTLFHTSYLIAGECSIWFVVQNFNNAVKAEKMWRTI